MGLFDGEEVECPKCKTLFKPQKQDIVLEGLPENCCPACVGRASKRRAERDRAIAKLRKAKAALRR
jgi:hypothetical protein